MRRAVCCAAVLFAAVFLVARDSAAQNSIAGVVKDSTGAFMPGVTVEVASPALIEKVRSGVSDGTGNYRIIDLPPGIYQVTFTLTGFRTVVRQDIQLQGNFTAQVNADLQIGALEETLTVTGVSPTVDVINNQSSVVLDRDVLDAIPTTARNLPMRAALIPGSSVTFVTLGQYAMTIHGSAFEDTSLSVDGMKINTLCGQGQYSGFYLNDAAAQEITYVTGAESAEVSSGGMRINVVPKDGGNRFAGSFFAQGANGPLQADNRTDYVKQYLTVPPGIDYEYQINPSYGWTDQARLPVVVHELQVQRLSAVPARCGVRRRIARADEPDARQLQPHRPGHLAGVAGKQVPVLLGPSVQRRAIQQPECLVSPEAAQAAFGGGYTPQVKWSSTPTSRLLLDAGMTLYTLPYGVAYQKEVGPLDLPHFEQTTGKLTVATTNPYESNTYNYGTAASASYVTGSHAFKSGMTLGWGNNYVTRSSNGEIERLEYNLGSPSRGACAQHAI